MPIVEWNEDLILGNNLVDSHHRHLVELLNKAHDSYIFGMKSGELDKIFNELLDYADYHFNTEEALMKTNNYIEKDSHRAEHQSFIKQVTEMRLKQPPNDLESYLDITNFLLEWLLTHIKEVDRLFCTFLLSKGVQVKAAKLAKEN